MKDFNQLMEDVRSDQALAEAISLAMKDYTKTKDKAAVIALIAEKGYAITEEDLDPAQPADAEAPSDDLTKLGDEELKDVAGGWYNQLADCSCDKNKYLRRTGYYRKGLFFRGLWSDTEYFCTRCKHLMYWNFEYKAFPLLTAEELVKYGLDREDTDEYQSIYKG